MAVHQDVVSGWVCAAGAKGQYLEQGALLEGSDNAAAAGDYTERHHLHPVAAAPAEGLCQIHGADMPQQFPALKLPYRCHKARAIFQSLQVGARRVVAHLAYWKLKNSADSSSPAAMPSSRFVACKGAGQCQ